MGATRYFEDVNVGDELPVLKKIASTRQLVKWAGISGDYYEIHYDKDFALSVGLPGCIVHGWLTTSFLGELVTRWMGPEATLVALDSSYRQMHLAGGEIVCKGRVTNKRLDEGRRIVDCEIWAELPDGRKTTPGAASVSLPSRPQ